MEIFGHAQSSEYTTFNDLNEIYVSLRDTHEILIVSDEISKSKPATLFFLSKFGCLIENIKFYSNSTLDNMWDTIDVLLTANPNILNKVPEHKTTIQYLTDYNRSIECDYKIEKLGDFDELIKKLDNDTTLG